MAGQINRGTDTGEYIYNICLQQDIINIVEIGTWNGLGSTKCIADAILSRFDDSNLISLETNKNMYNLAKNYWDNKLIGLSSIMKEKIKLLHGKIIESEDFLPLEEIRQYKNYIVDWEKWYIDDVENLKSCPNVLEQIPEKIDLLLLDGGEFSTLAEFKKFKNKFNYILLDDTNVTKCDKIVKELKQDKNFILIYENHFDGRNGFMAFKKKNE